MCVDVQSYVEHNYIQISHYNNYLESIEEGTGAGEVAHDNIREGHVEAVGRPEVSRLACQSDQDRAGRLATRGLQPDVQDDLREIHHCHHNGQKYNYTPSAEQSWGEGGKYIPPPPN